MKQVNKYLLALTMLIFSIPGFGQDAEMADSMRAEGKIYVVVAIILLVLLGVFAYLLMMDRKLTRLEKRFDQTNQTK
jgi:CcmD family protein